MLVFAFFVVCKLINVKMHRVPTDRSQWLISYV